MATELNPIIQYMTLDLATTNNFDFVKAVQGDNETRYLYITLLNDSVPYELNCDSIVLRGTKPDGTGVFHYCTLSENGEVIVELTEQMLAVPGIGKYEIALYGQAEVNEEVDALTTFPFRIVVDKAAIDAEVITSLNEFQAITEIMGNAETLKKSLDTIQEAKESALQSKETAALSAKSAATSENKASISESNAKASENAAKASETSAGESANNAAASAAEAANRANEAGTSSSNAQYYYQQSKSISESFAGALRPMGTVTFASLPLLEDAAGGDMYNLSDEFTTTAEFKEGSGNVIPAGANVYKTADGYWDVLAGNPVTGVKGDSESSYRRGNVTITKANIGLGNVPNVATNDQTPTFTQTTTRTNIASGEKLSALFGKIMKWFADLKAVAFSGSYNDLSDKPTIPSVGNGTITITQNGTAKGSFTTNQSGNTTIALTDTNTHAVTGVKGNAESSYRTGNVNLTPANIGAAAANHTHSYLPLSGGSVSGALGVSGSLHSNTNICTNNTAKFYANTGTSIGVGGQFYASGNNTYVVANNNSSAAWLKLLTPQEIQCQRLDNSTWAGISAASFTNQSSRKYKKNIEDMTDEVAKSLLDYRVVSYDYINELDGTNCLGLIAEEVAEICEYPVIRDSNGNPDKIDYSRFVPQLIKMVQIQQKEIDKLKTMIDS